MPAIRSRVPAGWSAISSQVDELSNRIREYDSMDTTGMRKNELLWPIFKLIHQRTRLIYESYKSGMIDKSCYVYADSMKLIDKMLIAKWKKQGSEYLCCIQCINTNNTNFNTTCICRVPKASLDELGDNHTTQSNKIIQCKNCGCTGCASSDRK